MFNIVVAPADADAVVLLPTVLLEPSCVMSKSSESPDCVTYMSLAYALKDSAVTNIAVKIFFIAHFLMLVFNIP
jgi:hypothetical protein